MSKHNKHNREPRNNNPEPDLVAMISGEESPPEQLEEIAESIAMPPEVAQKAEELLEATPEPKATVPVTEAKTPDQLLTEYLGEGIPENFARLISQIEKAEEREPLLVEARKLIVDAEHGQAKAKAKAFVPFNEAVKERLPKFLADIATEFAVDLKGRKLVITYPATAEMTEQGQWGNPCCSSLVAGRGGNGNGGGRNGGGFGKVFTTPTGDKMPYQTVSYRDNGNTETHSSLSALATAKGWKYNGRANGTQACTELQNMDAKPIGKCKAELQEGVVIITRQ